MFLLGIGGVVIQLANVTHSPSGAVILGGAGLATAAVALVVYGRRHAVGWRQVWGAQSVALALAVAAGFARQWSASGSVPNGTAAALSLLTDVACLYGLVRMIRMRLPGRAAQLLLEGAAPVAAAGVVLWTLVIEPGSLDRWSAGLGLMRLSVPLFDTLVLWQLLQLLAVTSRTPAAYKYLAGAMGLLLLGDALRVGELMGPGGFLPVERDNILQLWAWGLWGVAILHPSQRRPFPSVPQRNARASNVRVAAVIASSATGPALFFALPMMGRSLHTADLVAGTVLVPALVIGYLVAQVYSRANAEYHAQHDPLTGLCNRTLFEYHLDAAVTVARRSGTQVGVMFLDVDRFKGVNDSLGHAVGNELLRAVAQRVESSVRDHDLVARMGGDEFTILLPDVAGHQACLEVADRVLGAFARPFRLGNRQLAVTTSVGVAVFPDDGDDAESLLKNADTAMYRAKSAGRNTAEVYDLGLSARAHVRFALENSLRAAMRRSELSVFYQPRVDVATGRVAAVEALVRWQHRHLGYISPFAFVSLAEETGLIAPLGEWVLEEACRQAKTWADAGIGIPVSVNLSPQQFMDRPMVEVVTETLARTGLDPELLELELTESLFMQDRGAVVDSLVALRAMGVRCSIDDFGTGYSALSYLADIPMDTVKIDQSFVRRIQAGQGEAPLVGAVISLAHSLGLTVVAEGVETIAQLSYLARNGCEQAQGFIFSPALPASGLEMILRRQQRAQDADGRARLWATGGFHHDAVVEGGADRGQMAAVLQELCREGGDLDVEEETVAAILSALQDDVWSWSGVLRTRSAKLAVGALAGLVPLAGGLAATGTLPGSFRSVAASLTGSATPPPPAHGVNEGP